MKKILNLFLCLAMVFSCLHLNVKASQVSDDANAYQIYPIPQNITYDGSSMIFNKEVVLVMEEGIDEATENYVKEVFDDFNISYTEGNEITTDFVVALGIKDSGGVADTALSYDFLDTDLFTKEDAYLLETNNNITRIIGADSDGVFRGVSTLKMMFASFNAEKLLNVKIQDYASMNVRGFIEGFYGIWNHEQRMSLQTFAKDVKMNTFVWASKSDPYHTGKWNQLYPEDQLAQIKELIAHGEATKCYFAWSIHMGNFFSGLSLTNTSLYETRWNQLIAKLTQLYDAGVRRFDFLNDDFGSGSHDDVVTVLNRINQEFIIPKGCEPITYCPQGYNKSWQGNRAEFNALKNLDDDISLYWTGDDVNAPITQDTVNYVLEHTGQNATFWLNYPVNEHAATGLFLGNINHYARDGVTNLNGIVSNPSKFGESNKVALFQLAALQWNNNNFSTYADEIWENSFSYIQPEVEDAFLTLGRNISNCPKSSRVGQGFPESEYIKPQLESVLAKAKAGILAANDSDVVTLKTEFNNILAAIDTFREDCENAVLVSELEPWLHSLTDVVTAAKASLEAAVALNQNDLSGAWSNFATASSAIATWESYKRCPSDEQDEHIARAGSKRLQPFAQNLINYVKGTLEPQLNPNYDGQTYKIVMGGQEQSIDANAMKMFDGSDSTYASYQIVQKKDDYIEVDLGRSKPVNDVRILQAQNDTHHDYFHKAVLEYSNDGVNYTSFDPQYNDTYLIEDSNVVARYVRFRLVETGTASKPDYWTFIREFTVNKKVPEQDRVYTNAEMFTHQPLTISGNMIGLTDIKDAYLCNNEYVGVKMKHPSILNSFKASVSTSKVKFYAGLNTSELVEIQDGDTSGIPFQYIFIKNTSGSDVEFDIDKFLVEAVLAHANPQYAESNLTQSLKEGNWANVFDGDYSTYAWTNEQQKVGDYITFDLGGSLLVENLTAVMSDGNPRMYNGVMEISNDGIQWQTVATVTNDNSRFEVPYRYIEASFEPILAHYVRLRFTGASGYYFKLHELEINKGVNTDSIQEIYSTPKDDSASMAIDGSLSTLFKMDTTSGDKLVYNVFGYNTLDSITILQDPNAISNATVRIKTKNGYETIGTLDESVKQLNVEPVPITQIELEFHGDEVGIYEIYLVREQGDDDRGTAVPPIEKEDGISTTLKNIALGKPVTVSGTSNGVKASINDGDSATKWDSDTVSKNMNGTYDDAYMHVDFGENIYTIYSTVIEYYNKVFPTKYCVQVSLDGYTWQTVYNGENAHAGPTHPVNTITFDKPVTARYMRVYFMELNNVAAGTGIGVNEWIVNGVENTGLVLSDFETLEPITVKFDALGTIRYKELLNVTLSKGDETLETITPAKWDYEVVENARPGTYIVPGSLMDAIEVPSTIKLEQVVNVKAGEVDKYELAIALEEAEEYLDNAYAYILESYLALKTAYDDATYAYNNVSSTQEEVDEALANLRNAIEALVPTPKVPAKVENVVAKDTNYKTITLTWDVAEHATAYEVYRKAYDSEEFKLYKTVEDTTVAITGVMTGKEYAFYVVAKNDSYVAEASETVTKATTLHGKVTLDIEKVSTSTFKLSWNKIDGATRFIVYRIRNDDKMKKVLTLGVKDLEYTTAELPYGDYQFILKAGRYDSKDRVMTDSSNTVEVSVEKVAPVVTLKAGTKSVKVSWKAMEGVTHYQVYRAASVNGKYTKLTTTKELSYTAKSLNSGKKYFFKVRGYKNYKSGEDIQYNVYTPYSTVKNATAK